MVPKRKEMTPEQKKILNSMLEDGMSQRKVAEILGVSQSTVSKFHKRFVQQDSIENKPRCGRRKLCDARGDRVLLRTVKLNRYEPLSVITHLVNQALPVNLSSRTVRRRLRFFGYSRWCVRKTLTSFWIKQEKSC